MEWWTAAFRGATRTESDALGPIGDVLWGAQTQRYLQTVPISGPDVVMMPEPVTKAFGTLKKCTAEFNMASGELDANIGEAIVKAADEMISGELLAHFPIGVFQTGKGAQTNMCVNEVISNRAIQILGGKVGSKVPVHPNEHVDMGQSSDDSLSIAISIAVVCEIHDVLFPGLLEMHSALAMKSTEFTRAVAEEEQIVAEEARSVAEAARSVEKRAPTVAEGAPEGSMRPPLSAIAIKIGCTQQQDSSLLTLGHRLGCYALQLLRGIRRVEAVLPRLSELALGNTALDKDLDDSIWCGVGGMVDGYSDGYSSDLEDIVEGSAQEKRRRVEHLHAGSKPACSAREIAARIAIETGLPFTPAPNEVDGGITDLAAHDALIEASSALSDLAQSLDQIANDLRYFSTVLPHLDMPIQCEATVLPHLDMPIQCEATVLPHLDMPIQCEALQLACVQVLCNHAAIASSSKPQSDDEFDIFEPAMVSNHLASIQPRVVHLPVLTTAPQLPHR